MFGMSNTAPMPGSFDFNNLDFGLPTLDGLTIHEPAKRLSSKNGNSNLTQQQIQAAISTGQIPMDSVNKAMLDQQFAGAMGGSVLGFPHDEVKKYRCPVIGCEKAYKNQNGLKYHKVVS
jgi:transcription factor SFP1